VTESELAAVRDRVERSDPGGLPTLADARALLAALDERDQVLADLMQESPGFERGLKEGFRRALAALRLHRWRALRAERENGGGALHLGRVQSAHGAVDAVLAAARLGPGETFAALPPDAARGAAGGG
jgi:hypothetical protein